MGLNGRNNCLFFYSTVHSIAGGNETAKAIPIYKLFDVIVVGVHTGNDLVILNNVIAGSKAGNPNQKWYGYTDFGSTGSGVTKTNIDQWMVDSPPESGLLDGIFLDEYGHDFASGTRDQQNAMVNYCHSVINSGNGLPVFANAWVPTDVFGTPPNTANNAEPLIGTHATHRDLLLVESYLYAVNDDAPATTGDWVRDKGRLEYFIEQRDNKSKNVAVCAMIGAGRGTGIDPFLKHDENFYRNTVQYLEGLNCDLLCVNHGDLGAVSHTWFMQHEANVFEVHPGSGGTEYIKF